MGPTYYHDIEQGTPEWGDLRRGLITASTIGKLITPTGKPANNDTSRAQLLQLLAERITDESDAGFYNDDMARGHLLEPIARSLYRQHREPVSECGFITAQFGAVTIGYSPDGLVGDPGLIEIKCPKPKNHLKWMLAGEVPAEHMPQVQTGLAVTRRLWHDFISFSPGLPLFIVRAVRDEPYIAQLIAAAQAAEVELARLQGVYDALAAVLPATEPIAPEQDIIV